MTATHEIVAEENGTSNALRMSASGAVAVLLWPVFRMFIRWALSKENRGLKTQCELIARNYKEKLIIKT